MFEVENLSFAYPAQKNNIFCDISFKVGKGKILCILGPNGVGKSTLFRCLAGFEKPKTGTVMVDGVPLTQMSVKEVAKKLAFIPQQQQGTFALPVHTIIEVGAAPYLSLFAMPDDKITAKVDAIAEKIGISHLRNKIFSELSGGEQQLVSIARALMQNTPVIMMDEPTAHLDLANQMHFLELIQMLAAEGITIIFSSHMPEYVFRVADSALLLYPNGKNFTGVPDIVMTEEHLSEMYGLSVHIHDCAGVTLCSVYPPSREL